MLDILPPLLPQKEFINEDLTQENSSSLELILSNRALLDQAHDCAEAVSRPIKIVHEALSHQTTKAFEGDSLYIDAVCHGITIIEAASALVMTEKLFSIDTSRLKLDLFNLAQRSTREQQDWFVESHNEFYDSMPQTSEVVRKSSVRYLGHLTTYAVIGAAVSWSILKDTD